MLRYDHERTDYIVEQLRGSKNYLLRLCCFAATTASGALAAGAARFLGAGPGEAIFLGIVFAAIGYAAAAFANIWLEIAIEWMCQLLVAQGQLVEFAARQNARNLDRDSLP